MKRLLLTLGLLAASVATSVQAQPATGLQWFTDWWVAPSAYAPTAMLTYGVPETDERYFEARCGGDLFFSTEVLFGINTEARPHELPADITGNVDGTGFDVDGEIHAPLEEEEALFGVKKVFELNDRLFDLMAVGKRLSYNFNPSGGQPNVEFDLAGSQKAIAEFRVLCDAFTKLDAETVKESYAETYFRWETCDVERDQLAARRDDIYVFVEFENRAAGERSLILQRDGRWVDDGLNLAPGESRFVDLRADQVVMITDGPGNCLEQVQIKPGFTKFTISAPNRIFEPE